LKSNGTVAAWGSNYLGQLGNGFFNDSPTPVISWLLPPVVAIAAGSMDSLAVKADGTAFGYGWNYWGQLGNSGAGTFTNTPVRATNLTGITRISASGGHTLVVVNSIVDLPASVNFGSVEVNTTSPAQNVTFGNFGPDSITISTISIGGANAADFSVTLPALPITILANHSLTLSVRFKPTASGARTATLTFGDNGFHGPHSVTLNGSGFVPPTAADLAVTQTVVQSGSQLIYTIVLRNNGPGVPLIMSLQDKVPAQTQFLGISSFFCNPMTSFGYVTCTIPGIASGAQMSVVMTVNVTSSVPTQITNVVSVSSSSPDSITQNNLSSLVTNWSPFN
jgi:uncharacterized repeat protein (TIGR01451 family)